MKIAFSDREISEEDVLEYLARNNDFRLFGYTRHQILDMIKFCDEMGRPRPT